MSKKIIDKIRHNAEERRPFYSFEFFPPKTPAGVANLYARMERMAMLEPTFVDVTWGAGGSTSELTLEICSNAQNYCGLEVMMHLTCTNMTRDKIKASLEEAKRNGIRNILALRGDPPRGAETWEAVANGFSHAVDLVRYIREEFGDYFGICVAGYPEGHIESTNPDDDLRYLKDKVDAGADFVITQLFYDVDLFLNWVARARAMGIKCPIIPGIMPIQNYQGFMRMTSFCKSFVPQHILDSLEPIKDDDAQVKAYGIRLGIQMCRQLLENGIQGLHFYTLNLERSTLKIMEGLGLIIGKNEKSLPWVPSPVVRRKCEDVRPIFWANRPRSYLQRTMSWDEFPNGRWGDHTSPAFGDLSDYHLCSLTTSKAATRRNMWGQELATPHDVASVFVKYIRGEIPKLPWSEAPINLETLTIAEQLIRMNTAHFLTINSQPRINGADSSDPAVGWGGPGGYIYQKAYLEFFTSPQQLEKLIQVAKLHPSITYHAINAQGEQLSNCLPGVNAVTWGVFPGKEIIQPTVVDSQAFAIWKDEAFALWKSQWGAAYDVNSVSYEVIENIRQTWFLVNLVDNDYVRGDLFRFIDQVIDLPDDAVEEGSRIQAQLLASQARVAAMEEMGLTIEAHDLIEIEAKTNEH